MLAVAYAVDGSAVRQRLGLTPKLDVPYVTTRSVTVDAMLDMAEVEAGDYLIDLGTGDGRILIAAAHDRGASGLGVDLDPVLIRQARDEAADLGLSDRIDFIEQDLFETPLGEADVVTLFLLPEVNLRLRPRLLAQLRPGARVVSNRFDMGDWEPDEERRVAGYPAYLWIIPADVSGTWQMEFDGRTAILDLGQQFQQVSGTATIDGVSRPAIVNLVGESLHITLDLANGQRFFEGRIDGDRLVSTNEDSWSAMRTGGEVAKG
ncbi:hypothetical protein AAW00_00780 [Aurantiacibacter luteus]|uniref:Methyltransferase domain-containing protein n=1 Tax=Aurantiacibacter luteus TaxID=1581420 RepID=A0A0G9MZI0_9SPHN|nr:hypothetical protein AAW00_00780 [Aurantiacibacter luteus]